MMNWPNRLTVLRILLLPPFLILLLNSDQVPWFRWAALGVFAVMALCDAADGHLARRLNQRTRLGRILDPLADKLVLIASVITLARPDWPGEPTSYYIPKYVAITILSKDALILLGVTIMHFVIERTEIVHPSIPGKIATALTFTLVLAVLVAPEAADLTGSPDGVFWVVMGLGVAAALFSAVACVDYVRRGSKLLAVHSEEERV